MNSIHKKSLIALALSSVSSLAAAHGYVTESNFPVEGIETYGIAASRAKLCQENENINCGSAHYEPQSIEAEKGFPAAGPADGKIASGGLTGFANLDEQSPTRWEKRKIKSGMQEFGWFHTAPHSTTKWAYYITKPGWDQNAPLARSSFDLTPFCEYAGNSQQPSKAVKHDCEVPEREGYHVILSAWDIADTANAFYQVIDVEFEDGDPGEPGDQTWAESGKITPTQDLNVGDIVYTRVFDNQGENESYQTKLEITDSEMGKANQWAYSLAKKINESQTEIKAGDRQGDDFNPIYGINDIYTKVGSNITGVEIGYDIESPAPDSSVQVDGLQEEYVIGSEPTVLDLTLTAEGDASTEVTVYNHHQEVLANWSGDIQDDESRAITLSLSKSEPGHHMLKTVVKDSKGVFSTQQTLDFFLIEESTTPPPGSGNYDFVFPDGLSSYIEGTKVLARDGEIYECKPLPNAGYCVQWSEGSNHYEPGIGLYWDMAWTKVN